MTGLVSVVVPIYKVEKYLDRCVNSIVRQTYTNLEIILVEDGSPDHCFEMCDEWEKKDARIKVIHKKNEGLGMARNTGMDAATGEYICFFDADDYVNTNTIQLAYCSAIKANADVVLFGMKHVGKKGGIINEMRPCPSKDVYVGIEVQEKLLPRLFSKDSKTGESYGLALSACTMLISLPLIRKAKWQFVSERDLISEDAFSILRLFRHARSVSVVRECLYSYCTNDSSLTQTYRSDRFAKTRYFYEKCVLECKLCGYGKNVIDACAGPFIANTIMALKHEIACAGNWMDACKRIRPIISDDVFQRNIGKGRGESFKIKVLFWLMKRKQYFLSFCLFRMQNLIDKKR